MRELYTLECASNYDHICEVMSVGLSGSGRVAKIGAADLHLESNWRFHSLIYRAARRPTLMELVKGLWLRVEPLIRLPGTAPFHFERSMESHRAALDTLERRDISALREAIIRDISDAASDLSQICDHGESPSPQAEAHIKREEKNMTCNVAIIGCGLIGRAWTIVFARAGCNLRLWDADPAVLKSLRGVLETVCAEAGEDPEILSRVTICDELATALDGAEWVQENGPERLDIKRAIYADLDRLAGPDTILASSSSALVASQFAAGLSGAHRVLVAHPVNPPHVVPVVELCPSPETGASVMDRAEAMMRDVGQVPVRLSREIDGFVLNRLQAALVAEALRLVEDGIVSPQGLDDTMAHGLGRRWALMGPLATINLNAPGGVADYLERYGPTLARLSEDTARGAAFTPQVAKILADALPPPEQVEALTRKRDARLAALAKFLQSDQGKA